MTPVTVPLTDDARDFVDAQAAAGGYTSPESYIQDLIRAEQKRKAEEKVEALLLEGLNSPAEEVTAEWWDHFRAELRTRRAQDGTR
jgi:antitoxin ParD1/3/4